MTTLAEAMAAAAKPKRARRNRKVERGVQKAIAAFLTLALPDDIPWTAINPGGMPLPIGVAVNLKRMGMKRGWPDLLILWRRRAILFEVKRPDDLLTDAGRATKEQRAIHDMLRLQGCIVAVVESVEEVRELLLVLGVPLKLRIAA